MNTNIKTGRTEMINRIADISLRKAAIIAGVGLLIMTIFAPFAHFFVLGNLIMPGDAATTANNIIANELLFRFSISSFLIVIICDVAVAWALYVLLKPVNKNLSLLAAWFRLVYATIFGIALANLFGVLQLLSGADYLKIFETDQLHAQVMLLFNAFNNGWTIGLIFFGIHLALLGYLILKSEFIPGILGILVIVAGFGYLIDHIAIILLPNLNVTIGMFTFIGEVLLLLWLLFKGPKIPEIKSEIDSLQHLTKNQGRNKRVITKKGFGS